MHPNLLVSVDVALLKVRLLVCSAQMVCELTPSIVWGFVWLIVSIVFFGLGIIVGLLAFKVSNLFFISEGFLMIFRTFRKIQNNRNRNRQVSYPFLDHRVVLFHQIPVLLYHGPLSRSLLFLGVHCIRILAVKSTFNFLRLSTTVVCTCIFF